MKKYVFAFAILASIVITACSSDNDDDSATKNKQYPVSYNLNTKQEGHLWLGYQSFVIDSIKTNTDKLGYKGLLIYTDKNGNPTAFDLACPNCWNDNILTEMSTPDNRYECKICGLKGYADYGFGTFEGKDGLVRFVKYDVTKIDTYQFNVTNPK